MAVGVAAVRLEPDGNVEDIGVGPLAHPCTFLQLHQCACACVTCTSGIVDVYGFRKLCELAAISNLLVFS